MIPEFYRRILDIGRHCGFELFVALRYCVEFAAALLGCGVRLLNFLRLLRGRLIGRTPDFESGYRGSSPRPGAKLLFSPCIQVLCESNNRFQSTTGAIK
jgi:hypothetical protein